MEQRETRRINPIGHLTLMGVLILVVVQVLVIIGVFQLEAGTVAKYAPWAYEPFLRLVGEHPESAPRRAAVEEVEEQPATDDVVGLTGLEPSVIPVLIETNNAALSTNIILEATVPRELETDQNPTNSPAKERLDVVPVG